MEEVEEGGVCREGGGEDSGASLNTEGIIRRMINYWW